VSVHTSAARGFQRAADAYERGRPEYPGAALQWLRDRFDLGVGRTVVDVGAGTGKLTRAVTATGANVIAVEPVAAMRTVLEREVPSAHLLEGTAEALPLTDASVDVILAAAAFHWFDGRRALTEFHRVLRPGGGLGLIWNRRPREDELHAAINEIIDPYRGDTPSHIAGAWRVALDETDLFVSDGELATAFEQVFDLERFVDRIGSISFIAALDERERTDVLGRIRAVGNSRTPPIRLAYTCDIHAYRRR
jgi:ubiquinone/menaquinone biosynthesis C-methylase UbiE